MTDNTAKTIPCPYCDFALLSVDFIGVVVWLQCLQCGASTLVENVQPGESAEQAQQRVVALYSAPYGDVQR